MMQQCEAGLMWAGARAKRDLDENEWHLEVALENVRDYEQAVQRNLDEIASLEAALRGEV